MTFKGPTLLLLRKVYRAALNVNANLLTVFTNSIKTSLLDGQCSRGVSHGAVYFSPAKVVPPVFTRLLGGNGTFLRNNIGQLPSIWRLPPLWASSSQSHHRCVHSGQEEEQTQLNKRLPPLTPQFPSIIWPRFTNSVRNWFFTYFVIKPYFDKDFSMQEFMEGALAAVSHVSLKMSTGEFDDLEGLVEPSILSELKQRISNFSVSQQDLLRVAVEDVFFSFPYQIGIIIPDSQDFAKYIESGQKPPPQTRHVEITVVLHVLRGMAEVQKTKDSSFSIVDFTKDEENKYRVMVCNYRFFRDFTAGKDPTWIINMVNHFLPAEIQR